MAVHEGLDAVSLLDLLDRMLDNGIVFDPWDRVCFEEPAFLRVVQVIITNSLQPELKNPSPQYPQRNKAD
ncbi:MAG TPA: hypothetical protein VG498_02730 [Terriglobales bacterium]|nr:hypothetical protein [Terriglobales bacterium]